MWEKIWRIKEEEDAYEEYIGKFAKKYNCICNLNDIFHILQIAKLKWRISGDVKRFYIARCIEKLKTIEVFATKTQLRDFLNVRKD